MADPNETSGFKHAINKTIDTVGGMAGKAGAAITDDAGDFVRSAAISDRYEIEAGLIARQRARSPQVREVAEKMIDDHTRSTAKLGQAVTRSQKVDVGDVPQELDMRRSQMIEHLREVPDDKFDKTYLDQQVLAHEEAVTLMHHFRREGDCPVLRQFADETSPVIERHLEHVRELEPA